MSACSNGNIELSNHKSLFKWSNRIISFYHQPSLMFWAVNKNDAKFLALARLTPQQNEESNVKKDNKNQWQIDNSHMTNF